MKVRKGINRMLYIMRHGKTDWNVQHKLQGRTDIPLNENGIAMAKKAAEEEAKNTVFDAEDKAKKEAQSIAKDGEANVASLKEKAMANVDDAASIIVKNVL